MTKENKIVYDIIPKHEKEQITKKNCKLCQSEFREEAEKKYEEDKNIKLVYIFLTEEKKESITYPAVRNHLIYHYNVQENIKILREFVDNVNPWISMQGKKEVSLTRRIAILERELFIMAAKAEELEGEERRKNAVVMKQIADTLLNYEDKLGLANEDADYLREVVLYLTEIIKEEIQNVKDKEEKQELISIFKNIINKLKNKFGENI